MTTYATLKTDIESWLPHSDYTDALKASFIVLAESSIRKLVRVAAMVTVNETFTVTSRNTALPTGFLSIISVAVDAVDGRSLTYLSPSKIRSSKGWADEGNPTAFTIEGDNLVVAPVPSSADLSLVYYKAFDALSSPTDTNWLLTNHYDVYLYGSLRAAAEWAGDPDREAYFGGKFHACVEGVNAQQRWNRLSGQPLIRVPADAP